MGNSNIHDNMTNVPVLSICNQSESGGGVSHCINGFTTPNLAFFISVYLSCLVNKPAQKNTCEPLFPEMNNKSLCNATSLLASLPGTQQNTRWFKYERDYLCVNKSQFVPVIFEPPCTSDLSALWRWYTL
jgi:hypothetical protein